MARDTALRAAAWEMPANDHSVIVSGKQGKNPKQGYYEVSLRIKKEDCRLDLRAVLFHRHIGRGVPVRDDDARGIFLDDLREPYARVGCSLVFSILPRN